jgi:predicted nucleotidyltransferase
MPLLPEYDCNSIDESTLRTSYRYLPKDFVETRQGLFFAVVSPGEEDSRVLAFLRYVRHRGGLQKLDSAGAHETLQRLQPTWLFHSPTLDAVVHGVPVHAIGRHYRPVEAFRAYSQQVDGPFPRLAQTLSKIPANALGVTGSYLIGANRAESDIDLVVFGRENFVAAQLAIGESIQSGCLQSLSEEQWRESYRRRGCELDFEEYLWHERRKLNKFSASGVKIDLGCVDQPHRGAMRSGRKLQRLTIQAPVTDDRWAFSTPAVYEVEHAVVQRVLALTPTYCGQARTGEVIQAAGWLEEESNGGKRLIVGTSREAPEEFIRVRR